MPVGGSWVKVRAHADTVGWTAHGSRGEMRGVVSHVMEMSISGAEM
jgi:hypothetical protein